MTTQEALLTELLGDIGRLHDTIRDLEKSKLANLEERISKAIQAGATAAFNELKKRNDLNMLQDIQKPFSMWDLPVVGWLVSFAVGTLFTLIFVSHFGLLK